MALQVLIAIDQAINTLVWDHRDGFGYADETLSARAWRLEETSKYWKRFRIIVDHIFFWQKDHCRESFIAELHRHQYPRDYLDLAIKCKKKLQ